MKRSLIAVLSIFTASTALAVVDMKNATFSDTWVDKIVPGSGYNLRVRRTYGSRSLFNGMFGFGWCSDMETKIEVTTENTLRLTECGGGLEIVFLPANYQPQKVETTISTIVAEVKKRNKSLGKSDLDRLAKDLEKDQYLRIALTRKLDLSGKVENGKVYRANGKENENIVLKGKEYIRTLDDGTYQRFNLKGQLTRMQDKNGNYLEIDYKGEKIVKAVDNNGRQINFQYKDGSGKVVAVTGPGAPNASYKYSGEDLVEVKNQWNTTYKYAYDKLHNLTQITYQDGTTKKLTYNQDRDWVTGFTNQKGCEEKYDYDVKSPLHYISKVTKTCKGKVTHNSVYEFIYKEKKTAKEKYLFFVKTNVNGEESEVIYHEIFGKPVSIKKNGVSTSYAYFDSGLIKNKREKFRHFNYAYDKKCQKVSSVETKYFGRVLDKQNKKKQNIVKRKIVKTASSKFIYDPIKCNLKRAVNSEGQTVNLAYDAKGRIRKITDQSKKVVNIQYEERFGKPHIVERPGLGSIKVDYKKNGDIAKVDSKQGPRIAIQVANVFNNLLEIISPATSDLSL